MKLINNWDIIFEVPKKVGKKLFGLIRTCSASMMGSHVMYFAPYVDEGVINCNMIRGLSTHCDKQEETKTKIVVPFQ